MTVTWRVSWTGSGGAGGVLDAALAVPVGFTIPVAQGEALVSKPVSSQPPAVGTAFFPERDIAPNGTGHDNGQFPAPGKLRGLPRRRRPAMIALAVAMAGAGVLVSAAVYQQADHQVAVVMVTAPGAGRGSDHRRRPVQHATSASAPAST